MPPLLTAVTIPAVLTGTVTDDIFEKRRLEGLVDRVSEPSEPIKVGSTSHP